MLLVQPKKRADVFQLPVSFLSRLPLATNLGSAVTTVSVLSGTDANPSALVTSTTVDGTDALVTLAANQGVAGVLYQISVKGTAGSQSWTIDITLAVFE